jgi:four helix bundle protein
MSDFNQKYCNRSKAFAIDVIRFFVSLPKDPQHQIIGKQLFRSGTSGAANFRAATRARSTRSTSQNLAL